MYLITPGTQQVSLYFKLRSNYTALAQAGLTASSAGAVASYTRNQGTTVPITLTALSGETAAWTAGGFVECNSSLAKGQYRLDVPDAAFAVGVTSLTVNLAFTGVIEEALLVNLVSNTTNNVGPGGIAWTITVTNSGTGFGISQARVWVTTDAAGDNVIAGVLTTDTFGQCTFQLDAGTYHLWVVKTGFTATIPQTFVVS